MHRRTQKHVSDSTPHMIHLNPGEPVDGLVRRAAAEQIDFALAHLNDPDDWELAVHEVRKHCKKLRALIRLVRDPLGKSVFKRENETFRDAARQLSGARDSYVRIQALDLLKSYCGDGLSDSTCADLRKRLVADYEEAGGRNGRASAAGAASLLEEARERIAEWPLQGTGFDLLHDGLLRTYRRGRQQFSRAYDTRLDEDFHEWRKRVKYLMYQIRFLGPSWPAMLGVVEDSLAAVSDTLGAAHDLVVLRAALDVPNDELETLERAIEQHHSELTEDARPLGARLYAESPPRFVRRMASYWRAWENHGSVTAPPTSRPAGS